jgi:hypothetical protein
MSAFLNIKPKGELIMYAASEEQILHEDSIETICANM